MRGEYRCAVTIQALRRRLKPFRKADVAWPVGPAAFRWDHYLMTALYAAFRTVAVPADLLPLVRELVGLHAVAFRTWVVERDGPASLQLTASLDYFGPLPAGAIRMPYFCHPGFYRGGKQALWRRLPELRAEEKRLRLLFTGGTGERYRILRFPLLDRPTILECVRERFGGRDGVTLRTIEETAHVPSEHPIQGADYLRLLASSWVFLAPPGLEMPYSHNLVEAMSVGAIPLTNYGQYLDPPLVDGETCFAFTTLDELTARVGEILACAPARLQQMRLNVQRYYDDVLSPQAFGRRLRASAPGTQHLLINAEGPSVALIPVRELRAMLDGRVKLLDEASARDGALSGRG